MSVANLEFPFQCNLYSQVSLNISLELEIDQKLLRVRLTDHEGKIHLNQTINSTSKNYFQTICQCAKINLRQCLRTCFCVHFPCDHLSKILLNTSLILRTSTPNLVLNFSLTISRLSGLSLLKVCSNFHEQEVCFFINWLLYFFYAEFIQKLLLRSSSRI